MRVHLLLGAALVASLTGNVQAQANSNLSSLPPATQQEIGRICSPVQFREGATAYRNCVRAEIEARSNVLKSPMADLSFDDKYAVQQACAKAGGQSSAAFQECVDNEVTGLNREPVPVLDNLSKDEQYAVQQACFDAQSKEGAAAYRRCLNTQLNELSTLPTVNLSTLSLLDRNALQLQCSENTASAADYRRCLAAATGVALSASTAIVVAEPAPEPTLAQNNTAQNSVQESTTTATLPRAITPPGKDVETDVSTSETHSEATLVATANPVASVPSGSDTSEPVSETLALVDPITDSTSAADSRPSVVEPTASVSESTTPTETASLPEPTTPVEVLQPAELDAKSANTDTVVISAAEVSVDAQSGIEVQANSAEQTQNTQTKVTDLAKTYWLQTVDWFNGLSASGKALAAGLLIAPLALLALLSGRRRNKDRLYEAAYATEDRASVPYDGPPLKQRVRAPMAESHQPFESDFTDDTSGLDELFKEQEDQFMMAEASPAELTQPLAPPAANEEITRLANKYETDTPARAVDSDGPEEFAVWLEAEPNEMHRQYCIEFLIYWMAYGDERYDPALKQRLFTSPHLDAQDTIKLWVLKQDIFAFADVIDWLRKHCDQIERTEIIRLLMALLISENALTPVQNTLLRFLGDAFELGNKALDEIYRESYGQALPAIPRVDKIAWWDKLSLEEIDRWDSRWLATQPETTQHMARLGLTPGYSESAVVQSFRRASRRCHPDNFQHLGHWERGLATRAYQKYEEARDSLLGVEV